GRVITETLLFIDGRRYGRRGDFGRGDLIVYSPAHVLGPGLATIAPPCVSVSGCFRVQAAIHVNPADLVEYTCQPGAFLGQEAAVLKVALPVLQVDFLVSDIPVAAQNDLPSAFDQIGQMSREMFHEYVFGRLPMVAAGARG